MTATARRAALPRRAGRPHPRRHDEPAGGAQRPVRRDARDHGARPGTGSTTTPRSGSCILTGAGGYFCAGADLKAMRRAAAVATSFESGEFDPTVIKPLLKGFRLTKPLIAAVEGPAIAGGTEILQAHRHPGRRRVRPVRRLRAEVGALPAGRLRRTPRPADPLHGRGRPAADRPAHQGAGGQGDRPDRARRTRRRGAGQGARDRRPDRRQRPARRAGGAQDDPRLRGQARGRVLGGRRRGRRRGLRLRGRQGGPAGLRREAQPRTSPGPEAQNRWVVGGTALLGWPDGVGQAVPGHLRLRGTRARRSLLVRGAGVRRTAAAGGLRHLGRLRPLAAAGAAGFGVRVRRSHRAWARGCSSSASPRARSSRTGCTSTCGSAPGSWARSAWPRSRPSAHDWSRSARRACSCCVADERERVVPGDAGRRGQRVLPRLSGRRRGQPWGGSGARGGGRSRETSRVPCGRGGTGSRGGWSTGRCRGRGRCRSTGCGS